MVRLMPSLLGSVSAVLTISSFCPFVIEGGLPGGDLDPSPSSPDSLNLFIQSLTVCLFSRSFEAILPTRAPSDDSRTIDALILPVKSFDAAIEASFGFSSGVGALTRSGCPMVRRMGR